MASPKVSVCIPSRGPSLGLWATITSARGEWPDCEVIVCRNGCDRDEPLDLMERGGVRVIYSREPLHPATARDVASSHATGDVLVFADDHVLVPRDTPLPVEGIAHYAYTTYPGFPDTYYHFVPDPTLPTKGDYAKEPLIDGDTCDNPTCALCPPPYRCISASGGLFAVTQVAWQAMGGYGGSWKGFGGEEAYLGWKAAQFDIPVTLHPTCVYHHFSARSDVRGYDKTIEEQNYRYGLELLAQGFLGQAHPFMPPGRESDVEWATL